MAYLDNTGLAYFWGKIKAYVAALLAPKADDADVVHKTGNETINGCKTFKSFITYHPAETNPALMIRPSDTYSDRAGVLDSISVLDNTSNHYRISLLRSVDKDTLGNRLALLYAFPTSGAMEGSASLSVGLLDIDNAAVQFAQAPSTLEYEADGVTKRTSGKDIVTRDWIPKDDRIVHRTGNEVVYGDKVFTNTIYKEAAVVHKETENFDGSSLYEGILSFNHTASSLSNKFSATVGFQRVKDIYNLGLSSELNFTVANKLDKFYHVYFGITDSNVCYIRSDHSSGISDDLGVQITPQKVVGPNDTYKDLAVSRYYDSNNETPSKRGALIRYTRDRSGNTPYNMIELLALNNNNTSLQGIAVKNQGGICTCYASNPAPASSSGEIATAYWVRALLTSTLANYVTLDTEQTVSGRKYITVNPIEFIANYTQNTTLSNNTQIQKFAVVVNSNDSKILGAFFTCREMSSGTSKNYSAIRCYSSSNLWGDLALYNRDSGSVYAQINVANGLKNDGFHGQLRGRVVYALSSDTSSYYDPVEIRDTTDATRLSTIRVNRVSATHWAVLLGVNKINNSAPGGLSVNYKTTGEDIYVESPDLFPAFDNLYNLGSSSKRWKQVFAVTSTINTSDARYKDDISLVDDKLLETWDSIDWKQFKFIDAINKKGKNKARIHSGLIAQDIQSAFIENGIDPSKYGFFCYDKWDKEETSYAPDGELLHQGMEAGDRYSLRYEEALCIEAAYQRRENARLKKRIAGLEERLAVLELKIA